LYSVRGKGYSMVINDSFLLIKKVLSGFFFKLMRAFGAWFNTY